MAHLKSILLKFALFSCSWVLGLMPAHAQSLSSWLNDLVFTSPQAFLETRYDSLLEIEFRSKGSLVWDDSGLSLNYQEPSKGFIQIEDGVVKVSMDQKHFEAPLETFPEINGLISPLKALLSRNDVALQSYQPKLTHKQQHWQLHLDFSQYPKLKVMAMNITSEAIRKDGGAKQQLKRLYIQFANGDWRQLTFINVAPNPS